MKILIIKRDKIGDMLLTTPMLSYLHDQLPHAEIHMLANDYNSWVVADNPHVHTLWVYPRVRHGGRLRWRAVLEQIKVFLKLRQILFDVIFVAGGDESPRAIKRLRFLVGQKKVAYCNDYKKCQHILTDLLPVPKETESIHEVERNLRLLTAIALPMPAISPLPYYLPPKAVCLEAQQWLYKHGLAEKKFVVLGVNARRLKRKPTIEQLIVWSQYCKNKYQLDTVLMWTPGVFENKLYPGDDEYIQPLLSQKLPHIYPFRHEALLPALGILKYAKLAILPDGGLVHLAAVLAEGALALFAETNVSPHPAQWAPRGQNTAFIEAPKAVSELADQTIFALIDKLLSSC